MNNKESNVKEIINKNRKKTIKSLIDEMNDEKLVLLQEILDKSSIPYNESIVDYHKLVNDLKKHLDKDTKKLVLDKCDQIDKSFQELIDCLSDGSKNAFNEFLKNVFNIVKPISVGLAINTAVQLAPTVVTKLVPMGIGVLYGGYKLCKSAHERHKYKKVVDKETKLNLKIQNKEFKYDDKGNLIDTRFSQEEQVSIRAKLKELNVSFKDFGYQSLRSAIYTLPYDKKIELVMFLEKETNRKEFEKSLKKYNSITAMEKHRYVPITTIVTSSALQQFGLMNIIQTTGLVALNGILAGRLASLFTDDNVIKGLVGFTTAGATVTNLDSPIIQAETILITVIIAEIMRVFAKTIRNIKTGFHNKKLGKKVLKIECEKYSILDELEKKSIEEYMNSSEFSDRIGESVIVELITNYIRNNLKVEINSQPRNIYQLKSIINNLKPYQRQKIHHLMEEFKYFNKHPNHQFKHKLEKMLKTTGMMAIFGLAGLSIVDIFSKGEFFDKITNELFFVDAPNPIELVVEHPKVQTESLDSGLVRRNQQGEMILETTIETKRVNGAFFEACNYCTDEELLRENTGLTIDQYFGHHTKEDYQLYLDSINIFKSSNDLSSGDIQQLDQFQNVIMKMITKREWEQHLSDVGTGLSIAVAGAGIIGRDKKHNDKIHGTVHTKKRK